MQKTLEILSGSVLGDHGFPNIFEGSAARMDAYPSPCRSHIRVFHRMHSKENVLASMIYWRKSYRHRTLDMRSK